MVEQSLVELENERADTRLMTVIKAEVFSPYFADLSLNQWMALTTPKLVQAHLNLDQQTMAGLRKDKPIIAR